MEKDELIAKLEEAGIEHDKRWGVERLQEALTGEKPRPENLIACRVLRDYWIDAPRPDNRIRAGTIVDLDPMQVIEQIEKGLVARVK